MTPEKKFENEIIAELKKRGWFAHHFDANGVDGWPDLFALRGGRFMLFEVKAGTELRPAQRALHALLGRAHGVKVHVIEKKRGMIVLDGVVFPSLASALDVTEFQVIL